MKRRQAKKIVRRNLIRCRTRITGPEDLATGGRYAYSEPTYHKALRIVFRKLSITTSKGIP